MSWCLFCFFSIACCVLSLCFVCIFLCLFFCTYGVGMVLCTRAPWLRCLVWFCAGACFLLIGLALCFRRILRLRTETRVRVYTVQLIHTAGAPKISPPSPCLRRTACVSAAATPPTSPMQTPGTVKSGDAYFAVEGAATSPRGRTSHRRCVSCVFVLCCSGV